MKSRIMVVVLLLVLLVGCTPRAYATNFNSGLEHLKNENFDKAIKAFERAKEEKDTEEVNSVIDVSFLLKEGQVAFNEGDFLLAIEKSNKVLDYESEYDFIEDAKDSAKHLVEQSEAVAAEQKMLEDSIDKGLLLLEQQKFDEAEKVFVEEVINKEKENDHIAIKNLSSNALDLREQTLKAKMEFEQELAAKQAAEEQARKEAEEKAKKEAEEKARIEAEEQAKASSNASPEEIAEQLVREYVREHTNLSDSLSYNVDRQEPNGEYIVQVYEYIQPDESGHGGHNATYGWYSANVQTGYVYDWFNSFN